MRPDAARTAVIADRYPLWRDALATLLSDLDVTVVGRAATAEEAVAIVEEHRPDILVADYSLATSNGGRLLERAQGARAEMRCVVLSEQSDESERDAAFAAGACAYCAKQADPDDLTAAIRQLFSPSIFFADTQPRPRRTARTSTEGHSALTKRELEILRLAAEGHSNSELARMLWVTEQTIKFHLSNIYRKLDVANRTEASRWAMMNGLLETEPATAAA